MKKIIQILFTFILISSCTDVLSDAHSEAMYLKLPYKMHQRQGLNECGIYAAAAVITVDSGEMPNIKGLKTEMQGRDSRGLTYPWGIVDELFKYNINSKMGLLGLLDDESRIAYLKDKLMQGKPVIILNKIPGTEVLHWYTVVGYDTHHIHVYDSLVEAAGDGIYTIDLNGDAPGNRQLSYTDFLSEWGQASFGPFSWIFIEVY